jgi:hypothetical protein
MLGGGDGRLLRGRASAFHCSSGGQCGRGACPLASGQRHSHRCRDALRTAGHPAFAHNRSRPFAGELACSPGRAGREPAANSCLWAESSTRRAWLTLQTRCPVLQLASAAAARWGRQRERIENRPLSHPPRQPLPTTTPTPTGRAVRSSTTSTRTRATTTTTPTRRRSSSAPAAATPATA